MADRGNGTGFVAAEGGAGDRDAVEAYLHRQFASLLAIEGGVWFAQAEPTYHVERRRFRIDGPKWEVVVPHQKAQPRHESRDFHKYWGLMEFRADRAEEDYDWRDDLLRKEARYAVQIQPMPDRPKLIEVFIPEAVMADMATPAVREL